MALLTVGGFEVPVLPGTEFNDVPHGDYARAYSGKMRSDRRASHRVGRVVGTYFDTADDATALRVILNTPGAVLCGGTLIGDDAFFHIQNVRWAPVTADLLSFSFELHETLDSPSAILFSFDGDAPGTYTFTRSGSVGPYVDSDGALQSAAANVFRREWLDLDADGIYETAAGLFGPARTNLISSDNFDSGWTSGGTPVITGAISDPFGGTDAYRIADDNGAAVESKSLAITFTGDATKVVTFTVREATMPASGAQNLWIYDDTAGAARCQMTITSYVSGEPQITATTGTHLGSLYRDNGYWTVFARTTSVTAANTNRAIIEPGNSGATGSIDVYRVNAFDSVNVPPYSVLDASEALGVERWYATANFLQQPLTAYVRFVEAGGGFGQSVSAVLLNVGGATNGADPRLNILSAAATDGRYSTQFDNGTAGIGATVGAGDAVAYGDEVELLVHLDYNEDGDGDIRIAQSANGGATTTYVTTAGPSGGLTADRRWNLTPARISLGSAADCCDCPNPIISARVIAGIWTMDQARDIAGGRLHPRIELVAR